MRVACVVLYGGSVVLVLLGAALTWRGLSRTPALTYGDMSSTGSLLAKLDPGAKRGVMIAVVAAVLNGAASIWSLYLPSAG